jgi:tryptophanyl-tRNA synthetase
MAGQRVLSGIRPTGRTHLGNYVGAIRNWVRLQDEYECFYFIADWHGLFSDYADTRGFRANVLEIAVDLLGAGIDPERSRLFVQSQVPEHAELHLIFSAITPLAWLERNPTYKELQQETTTKDLANYGFFGYPVLQAADILIYKADAVPVGVDQLPHLELTREIARRFNHFYGPVFPEPAALLTEAPKLPGTDGRKMSKSYGNCLYLSDAPAEITARIRPMVTDPARKRRSDPGNPEVCPVFDLHRVFTPEAPRAECARLCRAAGFGCLDCKQVLLDHLLPALQPIQARRAELSREPERVQEILADGSKRARAEATATLAQVREAVNI